MPARKPQIQKLRQEIHRHHLGILHTVDVNDTCVPERLDNPFICLPGKILKSLLQHPLCCHRNIDRDLLQTGLLIQRIAVHQPGLSGVFRALPRLGKLRDQPVAEVPVALVVQSFQHPQHRGLADLRFFRQTVDGQIRDLLQMLQYVVCCLLLRFSKIRVAGFDQSCDIVLHSLYFIL